MSTKLICPSDAGMKWLLQRDRVVRTCPRSTVPRNLDPSISFSLGRLYQRQWDSQRPGNNCPTLKHSTSLTNRLDRNRVIEMARILFWTELFWPYIGGVQTLAAQALPTPTRLAGSIRHRPRVRFRWCPLRFPVLSQVRSSCRPAGSPPSGPAAAVLASSEFQ